MQNFMKVMIIFAATLMQMIFKSTNCFFMKEFLFRLSKSLQLFKKINVVFVLVGGAEINDFLDEVRIHSTLA